MLANRGRRDLCLLFQGRLRPVQLVLLREALQRVRAGAQVKASLRVAPHGGCHRGTAHEGRKVEQDGVKAAMEILADRHESVHTQVQVARRLMMKAW